MLWQNLTLEVYQVFSQCTTSLTQVPHPVPWTCLDSPAYHTLSLQALPKTHIIFLPHTIATSNPLAPSGSAHPVLGYSLAYLVCLTLPSKFPLKPSDLSLNSKYWSQDRIYTAPILPCPLDFIPRKLHPMLTPTPQCTYCSLSQTLWPH